MELRIPDRTGRPTDALKSVLSAYAGPGKADDSAAAMADEPGLDDSELDEQLEEIEDEADEAELSVDPFAVASASMAKPTKPAKRDPVRMIYERDVVRLSAGARRLSMKGNGKPLDGKVEAGAKSMFAELAPAIGEERAIVHVKRYLGDKVQIARLSAAAAVAIKGGRRVERPTGPKGDPVAQPAFQTGKDNPLLKG